MNKQMRLFNIPEKHKKQRPLFRVEIISEKNCEIFTFWKRAFSEAQAKKLAAIEYNKSKGFIAESFVKFAKVKEMRRR